MKFMVTLALLSFISICGRGLAVPAYSHAIMKVNGHLTLKYPIMSWEQLQFRRDVVSNAIAALREATSDGELPSSYIHPLLHRIMGHTVAIHSSLVREGGLIPADTYATLEEIHPNGSMRLHSHTRYFKMGMQQFEETYVPQETWDLYTQWGDEVNAELVSVLENAPASELSDADKREFFQMFAHEFDTTRMREIKFSPKPDAVLSMIGEFGLYVKADLPELEPFGELKELYIPRFPDKKSFFTGMVMPNNAGKKLEELEIYYPHWDLETIERVRNLRGSLD